MKTHDFVWMWQGIQKGPLGPSEASLLDPIEIKKPGHHRAILLLHGFGSTPAVFREILPGLTDYDGIFIPALPGHAKNIQSFANTSAQNWMDFTYSYCHQLTQQYEQVDVVGLSLGGLLAYHLSTQLSLHHLYLLAPAFYLNLPVNLSLIFSQLLKKIGIQSIRNQGGNIHSHTHAELTYRRLPLTAIETILSLIRNYRFTPPTCPTDVFLGKHDAVVNSARVEKLFFSQPHTTIHWLKRSAHVLSLDTDKEFIVRIIQNNLLKDR